MSEPPKFHVEKNLIILNVLNLKQYAMIKNIVYLELFFLQKLSGNEHSLDKFVFIKHIFGSKVNTKTVL